LEAPQVIRCDVSAEPLERARKSLQQLLLASANLLFPLG
jgi:hypothetical protein